MSSLPAKIRKAARAFWQLHAPIRQSQRHLLRQVPVRDLGLELLREIAQALAALVPADTEVLAGLEMGGIPVVTVLSQVLACPRRLFARRPRRTARADMPRGLRSKASDSFWSRTWCRVGEPLLMHWQSSEPTAWFQLAPFVSSIGRLEVGRRLPLPGCR